VTKEELASAIAKGLVDTGVEAGFDGISCSTAGDYPSIGCSQWEGQRANTLLASITGGEKFIGRSYEDISSSGELDELSQLLDSPEGQQAQQAQLAADAMAYVTVLQEIVSLDQSYCLIYAGMWCPTSLITVKTFLQHREDDGYNLRSLDVLLHLFSEQYATAADCAEYAHGYANRAQETYDYVSGLDLEEYEG
jgi:hypothetical protein